MEKQLERRREPEPVIYDTNIEDMWLSTEKERERIESLPRVLKFDSIPWKQNAQAFAKCYVGIRPHERYARLPICSMSVWEQILSPGGKSGKHRHYSEAILFIVDGEGKEVQDGVAHPFETWDAVCVLSYCVHQHLNAQSDKPVRVFFSTSGPLMMQMGIYSMEQLEVNANYRIPEGTQALWGSNGELVGYRNAQGVEYRFAVNANLQAVMDARKAASFQGKPEDSYDYYLKLQADQARWRQGVPRVSRAKERPWETTRNGKIKYLVHPQVSSGLLLVDVFLQELPPGGRSGKHRHIGEEVHKILDGRGYDIHDGRRWAWEKEDIVAIPPNVVHQHFNADPRHPVTFVAFQSRLASYIGHGGFEHLEDAPE